MAAPLHSLFLVAEIVLLVIYAFAATYGEGLINTGTTAAAFDAQDNATAAKMARLYPFYQDMNVMVFVGFGIIMTFLKTNCWTSVGFNFVISCWAIQLNVIVFAAWHMLIEDGHFEKIPVTIESLIIGDVAAGAVLISFGAILGKTTWTQLFVFATLEVIFFGLNETICVVYFGAVDMGGSMYLHTFGAYFGVAATYFFNNKRALQDQEKRCSGSYQSQTLAMIGTLFLFMYWPAFNGVLAFGVAQQRVVVNTMLSIISSCLTAVFVGSIYHGKFSMDIVLNATLAGGVGIGTASDLCMGPAWPILVGGLSGIICALGFLKLNAIF